ncbi:MAG TPA: alpha/beta fold hydrolase [Pyrinomonadaceae bacterium]|jgi:pimeloyl-ACP methyl ester carboxylesterase
MTTTVRLRGIEMAYEEAGRTDAPVVVLLHGYPLNRSMWSEQVDELSAHHRVVTPDLRGLGETTAGGEATTMEEMAEDVAALLDELQIRERVVLGGLSMGGYVSLAFYRLLPRRVRALILADTRATPDTEEGRRGREESAQKALEEGMELIADAMLPKLLAPETLKQAHITERVRTMLTATKPAGAAAALRAMSVRRDQRDMLPHIDVPTLILVGSEDVLTPPADAEAMHRAIGGSRLEIIDGAGHMPNVERPSEFNRALSDFLDTVSDKQ